MRSEHRAFKRHEVTDYEKKRYRSLDQRLVDIREKRIIRRLLKKTGRPAGRVLDLPCGYGRFTSLLKEAGFQPVASDYSFEMVRRTLESAGKSGSFGVAADAKKALPFRNASFPLLFSLRFLHHIHNPEERRFVLKEFGRVCSGWAVISYYQATPLHRIQRAARRIIFGKHRRISMLTGKDAVHLLEDAGFRIVRTVSLLKGIHAQRIGLVKKIRSEGGAQTSE